MLVAGNGESRQGMRLPKNSIGCNAVFRDHEIDNIVCVDLKILEEFLDSPNTKHTKVYTKKQWTYFFSDPRLKVLPEITPTDDPRSNPRFWSSGCYAVLLATTMSNDITLVGFDLYKGNIYKDTFGYSLTTEAHPDPQAWIYQISTIIESNKDKYFTFYNQKNWIIPESWKKDNVFFKSLGEFKNRC